ncbi:MAG: ABC transporter substrate-binding protein [Chloroflexi bacterium]|nr:ABC transporter substrate-binding protein [Chloroflexota bacterium]
MALKDGTVVPKGFEFEHVSVEPIIAAFRRMVRNAGFDISEMAISTYLCARDWGKQFTAIPVFPVRAWQHGGVAFNAKSGIETPKDLNGKRVGVRAYTVTSGLWARGILQEEYGVDLDSITWVVNDEEHVAEYQLPANVEVAAGKDLAKMLADGEIDAAIGAGRSESPDVKPLIPNAQQAAFDYYQKKGVFPINHTVVIQNRHLQEHPELAAQVFDAFKQAKEPYLRRLADGTASVEEQNGVKDRQIVGKDPVPYGVEANRAALEAVIRFNLDQKIIRQAPRVEDIFAPGTVEP